MADKKPTFREARLALKRKREAREAAEARKAAEAAKPAPEPEKELSLIDRIRAAFSSEENVNRIDSALEAIEGGIDDANKDNKRKK